MTDLVDRRAALGKIAGGRGARPERAGTRRRHDGADFPSGFKLVCKVLICAGLLFPVPVSSSLLLGHVVAMGVIVLWAFGSLVGFGGKLGRRDAAMLRFFAIISVCSVLAIMKFGMPWRFADEGSKLAMVLIGSVAVSSIFKDELWRFLPIAYAALAANVVYVWRTTPELYLYGDRLQLVQWGSPNTLALLIAFVLLTFLLAADLPRITTPWGMARWALIGVLVYVDLQSTSRGGLLALIVGLVAGSLLARRNAAGRGKRWGVLLGAVIAGGAALYALSLTGFLGQLVPRFDLTAQNASSGRTLVWTSLLDQWWASDAAIAFGFGPGSVDIYLFGRFFNSAHSIVISMLYWFGIIGLIAFIALWSRTWVGALRATDKNSSLRVALVAALTFSFTVDNSILAAQAILPVVLALAATGALPRGRAEESIEAHGPTP